MSKMTKKQVIDLMSYAFILVHNNQIEGVMTKEQVAKMMEVCKELFNDNEQNAISFIKGKVEKLIDRLDKHKMPNKEHKGDA